jgi:rRNA maturation protein Nop10
MKCEIKIGSQRTEEWTLTSYYCPHCAAKTVWEADGGVYPEGPELFCATCGGAFYGPEPSGFGEDLRLKERMEKAKAIREAEHIPEPSDAISPRASSPHKLT